MTRTKSNRTTVIGLACLLGSLICCPASFAQEPPPATTVDAPHDGDYHVWQDETVNLVAGGHISGNLNVWPQGTVNIHGGHVDGVVRINQSANVTVFGKTFTVPAGLYAGTYSETGTYEAQLVPAEGPLEGFFVDDTPVLLTIECDPSQIFILEVSGPTNSEIPPIQINIRPGHEDNCLHLRSNGVIPVAIFSTADFDATTLDPATIFLAGAGVRVRGEAARRLARRILQRQPRSRPNRRWHQAVSKAAAKRKPNPRAARLKAILQALEAGEKKYLVTEKDLNGDGLLDLLVKIEASQLDPDQFVNGRAYLRVHESSDQSSPVLYEGYEAIKAVPPE